MPKRTSDITKNIGIISSLLAALFTLLFGIFIVLDNKFIYFLVCLLLSWCVVVMVVSSRGFISREKRSFIDCAAAFAIMYAAIVSMVYYAQLAVVLPGGLNSGQLKIVSDAPGTVFFYLDMLGYCFLCIATLFMALAVEWKFKALKLLLGIHSLIFIPTFLLPFMPVSFSTSEASGQVSGPLILVAWCVIFIPLCLLMAGYFNKQKDRAGK